MNRLIRRAMKHFGVDPRNDIALSRDESSHFLPWIIALMVYLAALILAGSFTLNRTIVASHVTQTLTFSVHIPHSDHDRDNADKVISIMRNIQGVESADIVSNKHIAEMVEPWFGKSDTLAGLPLPVVIEGKLKEDTDIDYEDVRNKLQAVVAGATIDDHKKWIGQFAAYINVIQAILLFIATLIILTTASIVIFACKTSLKIHRNTVNLLHRLGAFDSYIATQFQNYAALLTLKGSFIGSGFASLTLLFMHFMASRLHSPLFPALTLSALHWLILFSLPFAMSAIALLVVRFSVLNNLRKVP